MMILALVTLQTTAMQSVLRSRPSWGSWPDFSQRNENYSLSVVGCPLWRGCSLSVAVAHRVGRLSVLTHIHSSILNAENYEVETLYTGHLSVQAVCSW